MNPLSLSGKRRYLLILIGVCTGFLMWRANAFSAHRADIAVAPPCDAAPIAAQGFDSARLCAALEEFHTAAFNFHSLIVERHGVVVAERYRAGEDRSVYSLFAHRVAFAADERHDMRSVSKSVSPNDELRLYWRSSQADYVLHRPLIKAPGTYFHYNGGATAILAVLVERGTGMPIDDYARKRLFEPMGIQDWEWVHDL
ncbi:MAG: serine hydrolase, partial [Ramlibacter sp.]